MKTRVLFLIACAMLLPFGDASAQKAGWRISMNVPRRSADDMRSVFFHTRHEGWAVGDGHMNYTGIYHTKDGGKTWERLEMYDGQEAAIDWSAVRFADAKHGWIAPILTKNVLRTTDGGENWEPMEVSGVDHVMANQILPVGLHGLFIAADAGLVHRTLDGGNTWQNLRVDQENAAKVRDIVRPAPDVLIVVLSEPYHSNKAAFYRSDNGGESWELLSEVPSEIAAIAFKDADNGVALGKGVGYYTADGGRTWKKTIASGERNAVTYVDEIIVAVGEDPYVLISKNGGRSWVAGPQLPAPLPGALHDIAAVDFGWWFAPSDREAKVYGFFDPENDHVIGEGKITIPRSMRGAKSGNRLPPGKYNAMLRHVGYDHALVLTLEEAADGANLGSTGTGENDYACTKCESVIPVDIEYVQEAEAAAEPGAAAAAGQAEKASESATFRIGVEPTEDGVAIVIEARIMPPLNAVTYLAALGVTPNTEVDAKSVVQKKSGGLLDRARKAAQGDLRGAVAGANPKEAVQRAKDGKAAQTANPTFYNVKVRYPLPLIPRN